MLSPALLLCLTLVLAGCGAANGGGGGDGGGPAPTATLSLAPGLIAPGQGTQLTFSSTNANQGSIDNEVGPVGPSGQIIVMPTTTTTYTFTATGMGGTDTASATVNVIDSFDAMVQADVAAGKDVDPNGAIGTKQYMEYVNTSYQAYDKTAPHAAVWPSPKPIGGLWPAGSPCSAVTNGNPAIQLDVFIVFDRLASRWVVGAKTTNPNAQVGYNVCLAVSNTDDLRSSSLAWNGYSFPLTSELLGTDGLGHAYFPDWPKVGTWTDASTAQSAYYVTMDLEDLAPSDPETEVGAVVCVFDRENIIHGGTVHSPICTNVSHLEDSVLWSNDVFIGHSLIPADIEGTSIPPSGSHEFMVSIENPTNDLTTITSNSVNLWEFSVDWTAGTLMTPTVSSLSVDVYTPGCYLYDPDNPAITNCVQEPRTGDTPQFIDSVGDRMMPRLAYRNFGNYESYLISHTIQTGPGASGTGPSLFQTGVRWYELRPGSGTLNVHQSGTINPDNKFFRFLPSIAQDKTGNAAVAYSLSNGNLVPEIDFTYWSLPDATDPNPNETLIVPGEGEEITTPPLVGKWGSYSSMTVDPVDDCTFWYVNEYFDANNTWRTRIADFAVPGCK